MAIQFLHHIDLNDNQLQEARLHNTDTAPSTNDGQIYFDTDTGVDLAKYYTTKGSGGWVTLDPITAASFSGNTLTLTRLQANLTVDLSSLTPTLRGAGTGLSLNGNDIDANVDGQNSVAPNTSTNTANRTYKVQTDSNDNLVVNVPWSDTDTNTNQLTEWTLRDNDDDDVTIGHNKFVKFVAATGTLGTNISGAGTTANPYIVTITSPDTATNTQNVYNISCGDGTSTAREKIILIGSGHNGSTSDHIEIEAGTGLSIARSGDVITLTNTSTNVDVDVSVSNLETRLGEIDSAVSIGDSSGPTVTIPGNLVVQGTTTTVESTITTFTDPIIELNKVADGGTQGNPTTSSGIQVDRASGNNVQLVWMEDSDDWEFEAYNNESTPVKKKYKIPTSYKATIGGSTSITVDHYLGTRDVIVQLYDTSSYETVYADVIRTNNDTVTVEFAQAPSAGDVTILILSATGEQ